MGTQKDIALRWVRAAIAGTVICMIPFTSFATSGFVLSDTVKSKWSLTYQPVLYIAPDGLALLYLTFNTEWDWKPKKPSIDLQASYIYAKSKSSQYKFSRVENQNLLFIEIGQRYYFGKSRHNTGTFKNPEGQPVPVRFPKTGFYFKPAIMVILRYVHAVETDYNRNRMTDTKKLDVFGAIGFYTGYKAVNQDKVVLNAHLGFQLSNQSETNQIIISPLLSGGIGLEF